MLKTETEMTLVNVTVTDPYRPAGHRPRAATISACLKTAPSRKSCDFTSEDVPVSIGVIFDMSGSMTDKIDKSRLAAVQFFRTANPQDEFFLVDFNDRAQLVSPFTGSVDELQNRLMYTAAHGDDRAFRRRLSRPEPDERSTQHKESFAHHIRWRR